MSRILFVTQYYPPESGAAARRISDIAARLVRMGHDVTVLTNVPNYPLGIVPPAYQNGQNRHEVIDGVKISRVAGMVRPNKGFLARVIGQFSFGWLASRQGPRIVGKQDVVIMVSPPLFTALAARRLARKKRAPLIVNVADLWPESAVRLGALRNPLFVWLAERLEWSTYQRARIVWVVTDAQRDRLIERGLAAEKVLTLPSGVSMNVFGQMDQGTARAEVGWDQSFTVLHAGTIGLTLGIDSLVQAAEILLKYPDIRILLAGDGAERARLEAESKRRGLTNLVLLGIQPIERIPTLIAAADACLVNLRKLQFFEGTLPVRMYEAMAGGRPVLLAADGLARKLAIDEAHAGLYIEPGNGEMLAAAILHLYKHPELARQLGASGRAYAERNLNRDVMMEQFNARITGLIARATSKADEQVSALTLRD